MIRKITLALAAVVAIGAASVPVEVLARGGGGHGGGFGGGFHGGGFGGGFHGGGFGGGFRGGGFAGGFRGAGFRGGSFAMARPGFGVGRPVAFGNFAGRGVRVAGFRRAAFFHNRHFRRFSPFAVGFFGGGYWDYPYYWDDAYYGYGDCYQLQQVPTRYGWRWLRVNVCG